MIGLSGGVDSAVAAYLLKKSGYEVHAGFMRNWDAMANGDLLGNPTTGNAICPQEQDYLDAKEVAEKLDIPLHRIDFYKEYWDEVFSRFLKEYEKGRTPNPDILCNRYIKFDSFRHFAKEKGFETIAMGHYALRKDEGNITYLYKAKDSNKDQTYFLSQVNQEQISHCLFPLGNMLKSEVRSIAKELHLTSVATKKDSTGICFIGERNFKEFLKNYLPAKRGEIVDIQNGNVIGQHEGVMYYTLGQRRGLGIGGISGVPSGSWFVVAKDVSKNILYVSQGDENKYLLSDGALIKDVNFLAGKDFLPNTIGIKFRYRQKDHMGTMKILENGDVWLQYSPYKAVTPGQQAVFYDGDRMLGGGTIEKVFMDGKEKHLF